MGIHDGHRKRLKEEFLARPDTFPDHKTLELLLFYAIPRSDTNPLAHELMQQFGSVAGLLDATPEELSRIHGVGEHLVALLKCVKQLSVRYYTARAGVDEVICTTEDVCKRLRPYFFGANCELCYVFCMDGKGKYLGVRKVGEGGIDAVSITARAVMEAAFSLHATRIVLAHNHTSGLAIPSSADQKVTNYLKELLANVNVSMDDHFIFVDDDMVSMHDSGMLER